MASTAGAPSPSPVQDDGALTHKQIVTILIGLMMGMFLAALDQTIVATAIRTIADDLKGLAEQAWATTAYLITSTIVTPLYGKLSDIYGRKKFFITAITIFVLGSVLCTFATSMLQLAAFRAVQGLGAGGLFSLALAIIGDIVPPRERAKYQGYFLAVFGTSSVLGPVIGGFFAGQDTHPRHRRLALGLPRQRADRHRRPRRRLPHPAPAAHPPRPPDRLVGRRGADRSASSRCCSSPSRAATGAGAPAARSPATSSAASASSPSSSSSGRWATRRCCRSSCSGTAPSASPRSRRSSSASAMFGGIACLPLYLQIVKGASPTAGRPAAAADDPRHHGRLDRLGPDHLPHRPLPALPDHRLGAAGARAVRLPLHRRRHPAVADDDRHGRLRPRPRLQHAAADPGRAERRRRRSEIGVATSSATFTRQIGGTLGTAVFLSILFSTVPDKIADGLPHASPRPRDFQAALKDPANARSPTRTSSQGCRAQSGGSGARPRAVSSRTARSSASSTPDWPSRSWWASPRRWTSCSSSGRA